MAVYSGNPADRATGNVAPGSVREAAGSSMSNGTTRNNDFGGQTSRAEPGGGGGYGLAASTRTGGFGGANSYALDKRGSFASEANEFSPAYNATRSAVRLGPNAAMSVRDAGFSASIANEVAKKNNLAVSWDDSLDKQLSQAKMQEVINTSKYTTAMGVRGVAASRATSAPKTPAMSTGPVSRNVAKMSTGPVSRGVPKSATGGPTSILSPRYNYTSAASTGPVPRKTPPSPAPISFPSTGPVYRGPQVMERKPIGPVLDVTKPRPRPTTVAEVRKASQKNKAVTASSKVVKDGYNYTRVGGKLQNFGSDNSKSNTRTRRKEK